MSTAVSHLSIEEFHRLYDTQKPYREYWFGEAVAKSIPSSPHGAVQFAVMLLLRARGWKPSSEVRLKISGEIEPIPDVVASREKLEFPYPTKPVGICVEILSADDQLKTVFQKAGHYLAWGVGYVWIIDPDARTGWIVSQEFPEGSWVHPDSALVAGADTRILLSEIFDEVDRLV